MTSKHQHPFLKIKTMTDIACFHQYNQNIINKLQRIGKEKNAVKQLDKEETLLLTVRTWLVFDSMEELKEALENDTGEEVVKLLCEIGVDLEKDHDGKTALHLAIRGNKMIIGSDEFHENPRIVKILLEHGASVHAKDDYGHAPLHKACGNGNLEIVQALIQHNADVNVLDDMRRTPLHHACWDETAEIVQILLDHGASVHAKDCYGNTPLHKACGSGNLEAVQSLIKHHADVHAISDTSKTPLHKACMGGHLEIVQELLKHKPKINAITKRGKEMTPLMFAVQNGSIEIVEELLKHGADTNICDPKFGSALHLAMDYYEYEHEQIVLTLLKNGCNTKDRAKLTYDHDYDLPDCTPLEMALDMESIHIVKMIAFYET